MYPHRIRLRGPWECEPESVRRTEEVRDSTTNEVNTIKNQPLRVHMPCQWDQPPLCDCNGPFRFRRRFGYPGRIDDFERVWLMIDGLSTSVDIWLNGAMLGTASGGRQPPDYSVEFEITRLLQERNELLIDIESPGITGLPWTEVALEVRCTAYLKGTRAWMTLAAGSPHLHVSGEVVGTCDRPLEIYVLLDNATVGYLTVEANEAGQPFHVDSEAVSGQAPSHEVRVELVNGASVWYDWRMIVPAADPPQERP